MAPGYEGISDDNLFDKIETALSSVNLTPTLRSMEDSNRSKFGPRSIAKPWSERKESLKLYFDHAGPSVDSAESAFLSAGGLRPLTLTNALKTLIPSSSSGLPFMRKKGVVKEQILKEAQSGFDAGWPCILFTRTQEQEKTRDVWGYPASQTLREQQFYKPFSTSIEKEMSWRQVLNGPDAVDRAITEMINAKGRLVAVDFSGYDSSVSPDLSLKAFAWIASYFQRGCHHDLLDIALSFCDIDIHTPDGDYQGWHGVPSGSTFTNTVDSYVQYYAAGLPSAPCQIQGDDGVYLEDDFADLYARFEQHGLQINEEKSHESDGNETVYLQKYYSPDYPSREVPGVYGGVYPAYRAFMRLKYLERWTDFERIGVPGKDFFSLRAIMILENCKHHPAFEEIVNLAKSVDKYGLAYDSKYVRPFSKHCLLYTSPSPRDRQKSRMPSSA